MISTAISVAVVDADGDDAARRGVAVRRERGLLDRALAGAHHDELLVLRLELAHASSARAASARCIVHQVDDRLALAARARRRDLVHLEPVGPAPVGEEQDVAVRRGDEQVLDEVVLRGALPMRPLPPRRCCW